MLQVEQFFNLIGDDFEVDMRKIKEYDICCIFEFVQLYKDEEDIDSICFEVIYNLVIVIDREVDNFYRVW